MSLPIWSSRQRQITNVGKGGVVGREVVDVAVENNFDIVQNMVVKMLNV